jgi:hypothetical protein
MNQAEIDEKNRFLLGQFIERLAPGEIIAAIMTLRVDGKGYGWYPAVTRQSGELLDILRKKPDEVHIEIDDGTSER